VWELGTVSDDYSFLLSNTFKLLLLSVALLHFFLFGALLLLPLNVESSGLVERASILIAEFAYN